jgi:sorting nexin-13
MLNTVGQCNELFSSVLFQVEMEGSVCRDSVCTEAASELRYLQDLSDLLLYLLLPQQDFQAGPVR